ncbi:hypothetical protein PM082_021649 [Marasmius tenuissimus]|nr:hypothetical protein PM082_021649 [Marasmius tenuissimus]
MYAFERILALSPSLEEVGWSYKAAQGSLSFTTNRAEEAERKRESERFRVAEPVKKAMKSIKTYPNRSESWERFRDLRDVETLALGRIRSIGQIKHITDRQTFSKLKHLALDFVPHHRFWAEEDFISKLDAFISSQPPLESLSAINYHKYIDLSSILLHHGSTLRSLSLHQAEQTNGPRSVLTLDDLDLILSEAPHLEKLEFDLNRTKSGLLELEYYALVASSVSLRRILMHYDLGIHHECFQEQSSPLPAEFTQTYTSVDIDFAWEVCQAVTDAPASRLENMVLFVGEQDRELGSGPWFEREKKSRKWLIVLRNERDDSGDIWRIKDSLA